MVGIAFVVAVLLVATLLALAVFIATAFARGIGLRFAAGPRFAQRFSKGLLDDSGGNQRTNLMDMDYRVRLGRFV